MKNAHITKLTITPAPRLPEADKSVYVLGTHSSVVPTWVEHVEQQDKYRAHVRQRSDALGKIEAQKKESCCWGL